jgi:diacylglycerol kinase (ATP)
LPGIFTFGHNLVGLNERKIAFIINRGSGNVLRRVEKAHLKEYLLKKTPFEVFEPQNAEESAAITQDLVAKGYDAVFACGGDGTLNTISAQLIRTQTALGIIPLGSGNGYARHHKIPMRWKKAIRVAFKHKEVICDTGTINGKHFINVAGVGYSAHIAKQFKQEKGRGFWGYAKVILKNLQLDHRHFSITTEKECWEGEAFSVEFANGSQWGADVKVDETCRMDDGIFTVVAFKKVNILRMAVLAIRLLLNISENEPRIKRIRAKNITAEYEDILPLQIDGDYAGKSKGKVEIHILPSVLKVWTPL